MVEFGSINAYKNFYEVVPLFPKVWYHGVHHRLSNGYDVTYVDLIEISTLSEKHSSNIQLINNSDKGSGNTLQLSSQATG